MGRVFGWFKKVDDLTPDGKAKEIKVWSDASEERKLVEDGEEGGKADE